MMAGARAGPRWSRTAARSAACSARSPRRPGRARPPSPAGRRRARRAPLCVMLSTKLPKASRSSRVAHLAHQPEDARASRGPRPAALPAARSSHRGRRQLRQQPLLPLHASPTRRRLACRPVREPPQRDQRLVVTRVAFSRRSSRTVLKRKVSTSRRTGRRTPRAQDGSPPALSPCSIVRRSASSSSAVGSPREPSGSRPAAAWRIAPSSLRIHAGEILPEHFARIARSGSSGRRRSPPAPGSARCGTPPGHPAPAR